MDISCLIGVCSALAQTVPEAAEAASAASAAAAASAASAAEGGEALTTQDIAWVVILAGMASVVVAQLRANRVVRRYGQSLLGLMGQASHRALGGSATPQRWDAPALLAGLESRRRAVLMLLSAVVLVYALAAAGVRIAFPGPQGLTPLAWLNVGVWFVMFAAFSAPVVLLGVSASNFSRLFWAWFGPATFAAVAMQAMVASVDADEKLSHVLWALATVVGLSVAAVLLRDLTPAGLRQRLLVWARAHWLRAALASVAGLLALLLGMAMAMGTRLENWMFYVLGGCLVGALVIGLCWFTLVDRIRRIVAPLLAAGYCAAGAAAVMVLDLGLPSSGEPGLGRVVLVLAGAALAGWLARNFLLSWIGLAYEQKVFSDAQFQVFCWMASVSGMVVCVTAALQGGDLFDATNLWLLAATALALLVYWAALRYGMTPLSSNKRLLVLRVFSQERRGERLLDELEYRWRFIGPIVLIGGPDVAERTIDPSKAANFLRGRLKQNFLPGRHALDKRIAAMDETPDPDGRYRVNEFFCFDDLWKVAVQRLLAASDAVVVDLSEFSAERRGTAYELGLLRELGALPRTVFLVSGRTDLAAVRAALGLGAEAALPVAVIQVDAAPDGKQLVEALVQRIPPDPEDPAAARAGEVAAATAG